MTELPSTEFFELRRCLREPIAEIGAAADALSEAVAAHLLGHPKRTRTLLRKANDPAVRSWCEPLLGSSKVYSDRARYVRFREIAGAPAVLPKADRVTVRMPTPAQRAALISRDGRHCAFCRIPLVRSEVRDALRLLYPEEVGWGPTFFECHAALLCMWLQYDHVLPHSRGGDNDLENIVLTCSGCNYGRMSLTLAEVGIVDPRPVRPLATSWDGLERILKPGECRSQARAQASARQPKAEQHGG